MMKQYRVVRRGQAVQSVYHIFLKFYENQNCEQIII